MSKLKSALAKKKVTAKSEAPKTKKSKTHEEAINGNTQMGKAIKVFHKATQEVANAEAMLAEAKKTIIAHGLKRMFERQSTQNITFTAPDGDVYIALKDQYTLKVNEESGKCDELEQYLEDNGIQPDQVVTYKEKASLNINKMKEDEIEKLVTLLADTFGQERMDEIFSVKTEPVINGLVELFPTLCKEESDWAKLSSMVKQHTPTINIPSKKGKK